jgi:hypothetical protein
LGDVKLSNVSQTLGKSAEVLERQHVAFKPRWVKTAHDIGKETLHTSIVQVLNYMKDSGAADFGHMRV